jgi:hypothetical protein
MSGNAWWRLPLPEPPADAFAGGFSRRDEANAIAAFAFRNGPLEALHAGQWSPVLDNPNVSRITDAEMKGLMINASQMIARLLELRETRPDEYRRFIETYAWSYCREWER